MFFTCLLYTSSMVEEINSLLEDGESLDANRVKAIFYVLYFGAQQPDEVGLQSFVDCFVTYTEGIRTVIDTDQEGNEVEAEETYQIPHLVDDPVSYTHLDVYKRQPGRAARDSRSGWPGPGGPSPPCLLYTSRCV